MGFELLLLWFCVLLVVFAALPAPVDAGALAKVVEFFAVFDWACAGLAEAVDAKTSPTARRINILTIHIDVLFRSIATKNMKVLLNSFFTQSPSVHMIYVFYDIRDVPKSLTVTRFALSSAIC